MIGAPATDREPERHRLQRPRFVTGQLEPLDVRSEVRRSTADHRGGSPGPLREQCAQPFTPSDALQQRQNGVGIAEAQFGLIEQSLLGALHREGGRRAGGDGVEPQLVAESSRAQDGLGIGDSAQWTESEERFVFEPDVPFLAGVDVFATDGAGGARLAGHAMHGVQLFAGQCFGSLEGRLLEIACRQGGEAVEREQIGHGA